MKECIVCGKPIDSKDDLYCMACIEYEKMLDEQDYDDDDDFYERQAERKAEELWERACECTCGAWQNINGKTIHVADCCCGAE